MGITDSIKDFYYSLEDKYYAGVDKVAEKVSVVGSVVDGIEAKGIPTFPLAIILLLIIVFLLLNTFIFSANGTITVSATTATGASLAGADVTIYSNDAQIASGTTNSDGTFSSPPVSLGSYRVTVAKDGYLLASRDNVVPGTGTEVFELALSDLKITKTISLKNASGALIPGTGTVTFTCTESLNEYTAEYRNGAFTTQVSAPCDSINIQSISGYDVVSFSGIGDSAVVAPTVIANGRAIVSITSTETIPAGLVVNLSTEEGILAQTAKTIDGNNTVVFDSVPTKKYYVSIMDPNGNYAPYDGKKESQVRDVLKDQTTNFSAVLIKSTNATLTVSVKDASNNSPIKGAKVTISPQNNQSATLDALTQDTGSVSFSVTLNESYKIVVDHPDYLLGSSSSVTIDAKVKSAEINMVKATSDNSQTLTVKVVDPKGNGIDNAKVVLKKIDETIIDQRSTTSNGEVSFYNLQVLTSYYAFVAKEGFQTTSTTTQVLPRQDNTLTVTLPIGEGTISVNVVDPTQNPLSGAIVKAMNYSTGKLEQTLATASDGTIDFTIRADKKVYFVIESPNYLKYTTATITPAANSTITKNVMMESPSGQVVAKLRPLSSNGKELAKNSDGQTGVSQGVYTITAVLIVPKGTFAEGGLHVRTGKATEGQTNLMEEDAAFISATAAAATKVVKGTTFTPSNGYDKDAKFLTSGNAKWANFYFRAPTEGVYEAQADITVTDANPSTGISLWYRGWVKGGATLRDPASTAYQNELYATAKNYLLIVGSANLCSGSFCRSYQVRTASGIDEGKIQYVTNSFSAKKGVSYELTAELVNYSGKALSGAVLNVDGKGLDISSVNVNGVTATGTSQISLGTLSPDAYTKVIIPFTVTSVGTDSVKITINSATKTELEETLTTNIKANKTLKLDIIPRQIIPYLANTLLFTAKDSNTPTNGVLITIERNNALLGSVTTSGEGVATFDLPSPSAGDTITITATKEGFDQTIVEKVVDTSILLITPTEVSDIMKIGSTKAITEQVILTNQTVKPLKVTAVAFNGELRQYFDVSLIDKVEGIVIATGIDRNFSFSIKANSVAQGLRAARTVTGGLVVTTEVTGSDETYETTIPINIRLSLPGFLDNGKCIKVTPATVDFVAAGSEQVKAIELANTCTAEGADIALRDLVAKLDAPSKFGTLTISGQGISSTALNENNNLLAATFDKTTALTLQLKFIPSSSADAGKQDFKVTFSADNLTGDNEKESVSTALKATTSMSNLSKCVVITKAQEPLVLDIAPMNTGYNMYAQGNLGAYLGGASAQGLSARGISSPYGLSGGLPYMGGFGQQGGIYGYQGYGAGIGQAQGNIANIGASNFIVQNNCSADVEVSLDTDARITTSQTKLTLAKDDQQTIDVQPGYMLGKYKITVKAKLAGSENAKSTIGNVGVLVRRLGDVDRDCIKINTNSINLNSFIMTPVAYKVFNYCYDTGVQLGRANNSVNISCQDPTATFLPLGNVATADQGCQINRCFTITGTSIVDQQVYQGNNGSVEEVTFNVYPNPQYIAQRKLFGSQGPSAGYFQNLGNLRQWATETDARTNINGELNVTYSNQYGSTQCSQFHIEIKDDWRALESLDSAINWGDPNANPEECVNKIAFNTVFGSKNNMGTKGEIFFNGKASTVYIPNPRALQIGAGSASATAYPSALYNPYQQYPMGYGQQLMPYQQFPQLYGGYGTNGVYGQQAGMYGNGYAMTGTIYQQPTQVIGFNQPTTKPASGQGKDYASKNCGLLDSITNIKFSQNNVGGVVLGAETLKEGSLPNNTYGSSINLEINRSGMTASCVFINTTLTATVKRTINVQTANVSWPVAVLVLKEGYALPDSVVNAINASIDKPEGIAAAVQGYCTTNSSGTTDCAAALATLVAKYASTNTTLADKVAKIQNELSAPCKAIISPAQIEAALNAATATGTCKNDEYGFDKINATSVTDPAFTKDLSTYCTTNFCNAPMLGSFLKDRFTKAKDALDTARQSGAMARELCTLAPSATTLDLYNAANVTDLRVITADGKVGKNSYYSVQDNKGLITTPAPDFFKEANAAKVASVKAPTADGPALKDMVDLITSALAVKGVDRNEYVIVIPSIDQKVEDAGTAFKALIAPDTLLMSKITISADNKTYYLPVANYLQILNGLVTKNASGKDCSTQSCVIRVGEKDIPFTAAEVKMLAEKVTGASIMKVISTTAPDANEIETIYKNNDKLNAVHKELIFNAATQKDLNPSVGTDLYVTALKVKNVCSNLVGCDPISVLADGKAVVDATNTIGAYTAELAFKLCDDTKAILTPSITTATINLNTFTPYKSAAKNVLLKSGFDLTSKDDSTGVGEGVLLAPNTDSNAAFYARAPALITVKVNDGEKAFAYKALSVGNLPAHLITWKQNGAVFTDTLAGDTYTVVTGSSAGVARDFKGIYYFANGNGLSFNQLRVTGGTVDARPLLLTGNQSVHLDLATQTQNLVAAGQLFTQEDYKTLIEPQLTQIVAWAKEPTNPTVCVTNDGSTLAYNHDKLLAAN